MSRHTSSNNVPVSSSRRRAEDTDKLPRWSSAKDKVIIPGFPTILPSDLDSSQIHAFLLQIRIEELAILLRNPALSLPMPNPRRPRSPSPPPEYTSDGRRSNLPLQRYRKKLEDERNALVQVALRRIPGYTVPADPSERGRGGMDKRDDKKGDAMGKLQEKLYIPARDFPEINFVGLLIGPRGNTLKGLEADSGAKISIRGKGSVKEGKHGPTPGEEEELHALVMADTEIKIKKAMTLINKIIETAASTPEGQNELKRLQLRELATLNGTLRNDDDSLVCTNCGETGHRKFDCPESENVTANLVCKICGGIGHVALDCLDRNNPDALRAAELRTSRLESEYASLMSDLGTSTNAGAAAAATGVAPWKAAVASAPSGAPWATAASSALHQQMPYPGMPAPATYGTGEFYPPPPGAPSHFIPPPPGDAPPMPPPQFVPPPPQDD